MENTAEDDKIVLDREELEDLVEKKVEERMEEKQEETGEAEKQEENEGVSRREFLRKVGIGSLGLGALSIVPASALNVRSDGLSFYGGSGSGFDFDVDNSGNVSVYGDISDGGTTIWDSSNTWVPESVLENNSITINAGSNLSGGGTVSLGGSTTLDAVGGIPSGTIAIWSGSISNIPSGWVLCDGNNSTPNLQDRFVVGAGSSYSVDGTGGSQTHTLTTSELASHDHTYRRARFSGDAILGDGMYDIGQDNTGTTGGDSAHENRPPYHALAYIMKS